MKRRALFKWPLLALAMPQALARPAWQRRRLLVAEGNSITAYYPWAWPAWVAQFIDDPWAREMGFAVANTAVGAATIWECAQRAPKTVDPLVGVADESWLIVFEICNALNQNPEPLVVFEAHRQYCLARRAVGFNRIGIATGLSRNPATASYTYKQMCDVNNMIRERSREFADFVLDFAAIPELGAENAYLNPHWFIDGVHPTKYGNALLAQAAVAEMKHHILTYYFPIIGADRR